MLRFLNGGPMIIWRGKGYFVFLCLIAVFLVISVISGDSHYINKHPWAEGLGLVLSGIGVFFLDRYFSQPDKNLIDPNTGEKYVFKTQNTLFFIPMKYWVYILILSGLYKMLRVFI